MDKLKIPDKAAPYVQALRGLIRTGVLASPALDSSCLIDLPVVVQRSGVGASPSKRAYTFIMTLHQIVSQRLEGRDIDAACILFGLDRYAGVPLQDRYLAVAKLCNVHWTWENYRKESLTRLLLAVYLALEREAELTPLPFINHTPKKPRDGLIGQDWIMESFDTMIIFPASPGLPFDTHQTRKLRAMSDKVRVWRDCAQWRERGISELPRVSIVGPGVVSVIDSHLEQHTNLRTYVTKVQFPEPYDFGQLVEFTLFKSFKVEFEQVTTGFDWYGLLALPCSVAHAKISLRFPPDKRPRAIWRYEDILSGLLRPGAPNDENRLKVDDTGFVSCSWSDLSAGYSYGISLEW